jgi:peroxiredoxin
MLEDKESQLKTTPFTADAPTELFMAMGVGAHAKRTGDAAPDAWLLDSLGGCVRLRDQWSDGPLIVVFFRGGWCHYCNLQLRDWQKHSAQLRGLGAKLLAITPQMPDRNATTDQDRLAFPVLSDSNLAAANAFGIAFTLPPELVEYFSEVGTDIPVLNGNGLWALPVPATYVIDAEGIIRYAEVEPDYRKRPNPVDALVAVEKALRLRDCGP